MIQMNLRWGYYDPYDTMFGGWRSGADSVGGVDVGFSIKNLSEKTIKYASIYCIPYNAVGDSVACSIRGTVEDCVLYTGPLAQNQTAYNKLWENAWYNFSITKVKLSKVEIQYMDGSRETIPGSQISNITGAGADAGCYVATAVYGSYDCPEVWTLRRFRDNSLAETFFGRAFIRFYYAVSPALVKLFGDTKWFKAIWKVHLDKMVRALQKKGFEGTPYQDRVW